jgi:hypothetical protein
LKDKLSGHAATIRKIAKKKTKRRLITNQNGGMLFLLSLVSTAIPVILTMVTGDNNTKLIVCATVHIKKEGTMVNTRLALVDPQLV